MQQSVVRGIPFSGCLFTSKSVIISSQFVNTISYKMLVRIPLKFVTVVQLGTKMNYRYLDFEIKGQGHS